MLRGSSSCSDPITYLRLSISRLLVSCPLHLLPVHAHAELRPPPQKQLMVVSPGIRPLRDATKAVQIELALKGRQFGLAEVLGHDISCEGLWLAHDKGPAVGEPAHDGRVGFLRQHVHELLRKGLCDAARFLPDKSDLVRYDRVIMVDVRNTTLLLGGIRRGPCP